MIGRRFIPRNRLFLHPEYDEPMQFRRISKCFIRKGHTCGKYLGVLRVRQQM
jgi:hypothetical protein